MSSMDNMKFYNAGRSVPDIAKKAFDNGIFSGTDINPMWRIKTLTEIFGPCGIGWYYEVLSERAETYGETVMAIVDLNLYIKVDGEWSKPIFGTGGNLLVRTTKTGIRPSDEGYKMALTDALSVACKALGIGADVYFEKDITKYTKPEAKPVEKPVLVKEEPHGFSPKVAIQNYCQQEGLTMGKFVEIYDALTRENVVPRIASGNLTEEQCTALLAAVTAYRVPA